MHAIKTVGLSGQISLGKEYAGRHVLIEQIEPGVCIIKIGKFVPENEKWLHHINMRQFKRASDSRASWRNLGSLTAVFVGKEIVGDQKRG